MVDIISAKQKVVKKSVSFRVTDDTALELEKLKKRVKDAGDSVDFRLDDAVEEQLIKLMKTANKELDKLANTANSV